MKRLLVVIIAMSYLCLSIGITVHIHNCMGNKIGASLVEQKDNHHCSHCGMDKTSSKNGCCKDEHKTFKSTNEQLVSKILLEKANFMTEVLPVLKPVFQYQSNYTPVFKNISAQSNAPPIRALDCPIYLRFQNFRV